MHRTPSGDRRQALQKKPGSWPAMPEPCRRYACAPAVRMEAERLQGEAETALAEVVGIQEVSRRQKLSPS